MKIKRTVPEVIFDYFNVIFMFIIIFVMLFPFWNIIANSFNEGRDSLKGGIYFWPRVWSIDNYKAVFANTLLIGGYVITISRTLIGTAAAVLFTGVVAFSLSHKDLVFRKYYMFIGVVTMFFGGGLIPYYMLIRNIGLYNSFWVYIIPSMFSFYNMVIMMTFFRQLPAEMEESAKIDGAGYLRIYLRIILPLSAPIIATMALFNGVGHWNDFFTAYLFIKNEDLLPVQTILYKIIVENKAQEMADRIPEAALRRKITPAAVRDAALIVTTFPVMCVYPLLQKYFAKGFLVGSVKG